VVQPDLFVASVDPVAPPASWEEIAVPILVVEVLSPSTARQDRITKRRRYQQSGVPVYWIVDLEARLVEVWTPDAQSPRIVDDVLIWKPLDEGEPLAITLQEVFVGL
jgi:Uma2 family endonuclease